MPPKTKITREMIIDAAFAIARREGADKITARSISEHLKCSTQPVLYQFSTIEEIKQAVYQKADEFHGNYLMNMEKEYEDPMIAIGINYIRFAMEERHLFRFLFQSNEFSGTSMFQLVDSADIAPILTVFMQEMETTMEETKDIFTTLFIYIHGYASLFANNEMIYEEKELIEKLTKVFYAAVYAAKGGYDEENI